MISGGIKANSLKFAYFFLIRIPEVQWVSRFLSKLEFWALNNSYIIRVCLLKRALVFLTISYLVPVKRSHILRHHTSDTSVKRHQDNRIKDKNLQRREKAIFTIFSVMSFFDTIWHSKLLNYSTMTLVISIMSSLPISYVIIWLILKYSMVFKKTVEKTISYQWSLFILPENIQKPLVFGCFQGV